MSCETPPDSPSKHTRSQQRARGSSPSVVIQSPPRKRAKRGGGIQTDTEVWAWTDEKIIQESTQHWTSITYKHFTPTVSRVAAPNGGPGHIDFVFKCKDDPVNCQHTRRRMLTSEGTSNLKRKIVACLKRRGIADDGTGAGAQQTITGTISKYTPSRHRALIAMRCARRSRPFNMVNDPEYKDEVELLRPGTKIPSSQTVSDDVRLIYDKGAKSVKEYFSTHVGSVHLVIDGWTAPFATSYLGIVVVWFADGKIWRAILEFIRLTERHTGDYLARVTADCVKRFGLENKIHTLAMDNASNCDSLAKRLPDYIPSFRGLTSRTRCMPHIVNLVAKAFLSFFYPQAARKKIVKVATESKKKNKRGLKTGTNPFEPNGADRVVTDGNDATEFSVAQHELLNDDNDFASNSNAALPDEAKAEHDAAAVKGVNLQARREARETYGISIPPRQDTEASTLMAKVGGLARETHDHYLEAFRKHLAAKQSQPSAPPVTKNTLDRRVPTRWNSDFICLQAHVALRFYVTSFVKDPDYQLEEYGLSMEQWKLADNASDIMVIYKQITDLFSKTEVPLIFETVPMLEDMEHELEEVRNDASLAEVVRVASHAALLMVGKYYALTDDCEVYRIAIVMCPNKKLKYFEANPDWRPEDVQEVKRLVEARWQESYAADDLTATEVLVNTPTPDTTQRSRWARREHPKATAGGPSRSTQSHDSIGAYLSAPVVSPAEIESAGGVLKYWDHMRATRPRLAQMALDFLSAPASSVDAERAFSCGRLQVNHLQHGTSSQSFKAKLAIGSWSRTPLLPPHLAEDFISARIKGQSGKGKGKAVEPEHEPNDIDIN